MKSHYTAAELAALKLPGLPGTKQGIIDKAKRDFWPSQARTKSGGGREYPITALPSESQNALLERTVQTRAVAHHKPHVPAADLPDVASLKSCQRTVMDARAVLLAEIDRLRLSGVGTSKAVATLVQMAGNGTLPPELQAAVKQANARAGQGNRTITRATLYNWLAARKRADGKTVSLAPIITPEAEIPAWADAFLNIWGCGQNKSLSQVYREARESMGDQAPSYDQVRRFIAKLDVISKHKGRVGYRDLLKFKAFKARSFDDLWPGSVVIGDGHTFKSEVAHPISGRPFRPELTEIIDGYTRRIGGWSVDLSESAQSVAAAFTDFCVRSTEPDILYYDNGTGIKNKHIKDPITGLASRVGSTIIHSIALRSQSRGVIEIIHKTVMHPAAKTLATYVGPDMDKTARQNAYKITRKEIKEHGRSRLLPTWQEFIALLDDAITAYNARPHSSLPKIIDPETGKRRHMSPDEMWNKAIADGWQPSPVPAEEAADLFRPQLVRKTSRGLVSLFGNDYFHTSLANLYQEDVIVGYDAHDASKVWVRDMEGRFICEAAWNAHRTSYVPVPFAQQAREKRIDMQVKRARKHIEGFEAARQPALEHQPMESASFIDITPQAEPVPVAKPATQRIDETTGRPIFKTDSAYAAWIADNPDALNDHDRAWLKDALDSGTFRMLAEVEGLNVAYLKSLTRHPVSEVAA
ncbi:MAG: Mu transposase C-terminal domain-containing protein [Alphaproteobacteria bacterium]|nr:Mu transposase C-terminal domain-containing protein [Alphaproteobacteria bacterium]